MEVQELKTFFVVNLYMGVNNFKEINPSVKAYWARSEMLLWCPIISNVMTRDRFLPISCCLHIVNGTYVTKIERLLRMTNCTSEEGYWMNLEILA